MIRLQSQKQLEFFFVFQVSKFIALFFNTSRYVNKPREYISGRAVYLERESSKFRTTHY